MGSLKEREHMIRILLADDHNIFRQGLKEVIENASDIKVTAEAATGRETIREALSDDCDVVLLDLTLPDIHGLDVLKQIRQACPDKAVLVLTMHPEEQYGLRALRAGAAGYLTKDCEAEELLDAIRRAFTGGMYITACFAELIAGSSSGGKKLAPHEILSDREFQILCMIAGGKRIKDIAEHLSLSPKTVSTYRNRLLQKLNMETNEQLTTYAMNHKLLD
jgi:DNA-binding NarL/FixJ family response regulator